MAYTAERRAKMVAFMNSVKDQVLESDDPILVNLAEQDVVEDIATEIDLIDGGGVCLLTGQSGTGKSTALKRLKQRLEELGATVFYVDLSRVLVMNERIEISDFLVAVAGAMSEQVEQAFGSSPGQVGYWDRIKNFLQTTVEFKELSASFAGVSIKTELKESVEFKKRMQAALRSSIPRLVDKMRDFVSDCLTQVRAVRGTDSIEVVLLVDSVERIHGLGEQEKEVYDSVRDLFLYHAQSLILPMLHVVYTVPPYLLMLAPGAVSNLRATQMHRLSYIHVSSKGPSRVPDQSGLDKMRAVLQARFQGWREIFEPNAIDNLAINSGGDLRQFLRSIQACLVYAVRRDMTWPLSVATLDPILLGLRNEKTQLASEHLDWLQKIMRSNEPCLVKEQDISTFVRFLDNQQVLTYRNGQDWYDVHPLLRELVDAHVVRAVP